MKKYAILAAAFCFPLLGAANCTQTSTSIDNALATLAKNDIPAACTIVGVAEGYFNELQSKLSAAEIADEQKAALVVKAICDNPPTNITAAFGTLLTAWTTIQNDTTIPTPAPTPTPTASP